MKSLRGPWFALTMTTLALGCAGGSSAPDLADPDGPGLAVNIAALSLTGVGDVVWDLEVDNGAGAVVWQRRITSSGYGDSAGSASYVAPCDADPAVALNRVKVWVVGVYDADISAANAGAFNATHDGVTGTAMPFQNPTTAGPLTQDVTCAENTDVAVRFDVALMRPAQQGFFDIAVNFNDIFCSAKLDCCEDTDANGCAGDGSEDIDLLFAPGGGRDRTIVLGFACTAGASAGVDTTLYLDALGLDCSAPNDSASFSADIVIDPAAGPGNLCTAGDLASCPAITTGAGLADTYLFQVATFRGEEQLLSDGVDAQKVYWNIALGVKPAISGCRLQVAGTADDAANTQDHVDGGIIDAGTIYPYVQWDAALDGTCASEALTFGDATAPVRTAYTTTGGAGATFAYGFGPSLPAGSFCDPVCVHGTCVTGACQCDSGWAGDACDLPATLVGYWQLDDGSGATAVDSTTYANDATLTGNAAWTTGVQAGALSLDGNGDYATIARPMPTEQRPTAVTLEAWVYPNAYSNPLGDIVGGIIAAQWDPTTSCWSMSLDYRSGVHGGVLGGIHWQVGSTGGYWANGSQGTTATAVPLNQWTHIACVAEPGARYEVYLNGTKVTNWTAGANIKYDDACHLTIGWNDHTTGGGSQRFFNGLVDDVRIYAEARTQAQIQADYDATKP